MPTPHRGMYYSDLIVGEKEDVSDDLFELAPSATPLLNALGFAGAGPLYSLTHKYLDDARVPLRATLKTGIDDAVTTVDFNQKIFKEGQLINMEGEVILLGPTADGGETFTGCTRSVGQEDAAAHVAGVKAQGLGRPDVQGEDAGSGDVEYEPREVTTYGQGFSRVASVPDETNVARIYGRPGAAYDRKIEGYIKELGIEIEDATMFGVAQAPVPSSGTPGRFDGIKERVYATNNLPLAGADIAETDLRDMVDVIADFYDPDLELNALLLVPLSQSSIFDGWQSNKVQVAPSDPLVQKYGVHVIRLEIGPMLIDVLPVNRLDTDGFLIQPQYIKPLKMIPLTHEVLARTGRYTKGQVAGTFSLEVNCPEAHYVITGIKNS